MDSNPFDASPFSPLPVERIPGLDSLILEYREFTPLNYAEIRLNDLENMGVELDPDPTEKDFSVLNIKIAAINAQKTRCTTILNNAIEKESELEILVREAKQIYARESRKWKISDVVRKLSSKDLRDAAVDAILEALLDFISDAEGSLYLAKSFSKEVKGVADMLESTNRNVSRQITVLQQQFAIGEIGRGAQNTYNHKGNG